MKEAQNLTVSLEPDNAHTTKTVELGRFFVWDKNGEMVGSMALSARIVMGIKTWHYTGAVEEIAREINAKIRQWQAEQIAVAMKTGAPDETH